MKRLRGLLFRFGLLSAAIVAVVVTHAI